MFCILPDIKKLAATYHDYDFGISLTGDVDSYRNGVNKYSD